jgi:hypothetical protein
MPYANPELRNLSTKKRKEALGKAAPPEGWTPTKVATDQNGVVRSVRSVPEPVEDQFQPVIPKEHYVRAVSSFLDHGDVTHQWVKTDTVKMQADAQRWAAIQSLVAAGVEPRPPVTLIDEEREIDLCNMIVFGDPHFGMLAQARETGAANWDIKIAKRVMRDALTLMLSRLPKAGSCLLVNIGDYFHFQDNSKTTPRGKHALDGDCRMMHMAEMGCYLMAELTELCLEHYGHVTAANVAGNHDPEAARWLNVFMKAYFRQQGRLTLLDNAREHLYTTFGQNLIGLYHGHETPLNKLPAVMAADQREAWGAATHCRWVTGHHHQYEAHSFPEVLVEKYPTLAPADVWSAGHGYRSERSLNAVTLHCEHGERGRAKVYAAEVE